MVASIKKIFFQPLSVISIRLNERPVEPLIVSLALCYFLVNIFLILAGGCFMTLVDDMDWVTAMSSVIATLMNIGPGFGGVGPTENYASISAVGKWFLSWLMLVGRLEMFSALVVFYPSFWRR
jgi:trk system potassium uptake protein TrkH